MAFVQADKNGSTSAGSNTTPGITTTSGNFLMAVVCVGGGPRTVSSFVDSYSNTWTAATGNPRAPNGQFNVYVYWAHNITGGAAHTITATFSGSGVSAISMMEFSGRATSSAVLVQTGSLDTSGATSHLSGATGTLSESGADVMYMGGDNAPAVGSNQTYTVTSTGWVRADNATHGTVTQACIQGFYRENVDTSDQQATWTNSGGSNIRSAGVIIAVKSAGGSPAVLSAATPSGTLGTSTSAAIGATTDVSSGTFYAVVDTAGNISGITAAQVKAGQNNASASAVSANSVAVSTTSPQTTCTGLSVATAYSYAVVQNSTGGDSNVLTGTFTTAAAAANPQTREYGPQGSLRTILTM